MEVNTHGDGLDERRDDSAALEVGLDGERVKQPPGRGDLVPDAAAHGAVGPERATDAQERPAVAESRPAGVDLDAELASVVRAPRMREHGAAAVAADGPGAFADVGPRPARRVGDRDIHVASVLPAAARPEGAVIGIPLDVREPGAEQEVPRDHRLDLEQLGAPVLGLPMHSPRSDDLVTHVGLGRKPEGDALGVVAGRPRKLGVLIHQALKHGHAFVGTGIAAYEKQQQDRQLRSLQKRAAALGFQLLPGPTEPAAAAS